MQLFPKSKGSETPANLHSEAKPYPLQSLHSHCSSFLHHFSTSLSANLAASQLKSQLESAMGNLGSQAKHFLHAGVSRPTPVPSPSPSSAKSPAWARIASERRSEPVHAFDIAMKPDELEERLAGIPVYALSNSGEEFMLVSGVKTGKSLGLLCFKKEDAESLLEEMKVLNPGMEEGSKVVSVALNKVFQLKVNGVAFRLIPDSHQILNAIKVMEQFGESADGFPGVPIFQSKSLVLRSQNKRYRPVFFRKEDLEDSLYRASQQQSHLNPALRKGDIQVYALEDLIMEMKGNSRSSWNDVVFIPPGFDVSVHLGQQERPTAAA